MVMNKAVIAVSFALLLGLYGCSRQQSDWEKTRASNTTEAYEQFLKKYPSGEFTAQAQARVKELYEEHDWQKARDTDTQEAYQAFLKQYPEGKWTEEARIRVENFTLAQAPSSTTPAADTANTPNPAAGGTAATAGAGKPPTASPVPVPAPAPGSPPHAPGGSSTASPAKAAASTSAAKPAGEAGSYGIQLGAFKSSADAANRRWTHLDKEYPKVLNGLSPTVAPKKSASGTLYRLQVTGLTEKRARAICVSLKAKSQACVLVLPTHR
jgi:cell division protein FtsN